MQRMQWMRNDKGATQRSVLKNRWYLFMGYVVTGFAVGLITGTHNPALAAEDGPTVLDPTLNVRTVVSGLETPTSMAFIGPDDILVLEKNTVK